MSYAARSFKERNMHKAAIKIVKFMKKHRLSDEEFGEMAGVSSHAVKKYRRGLRIATKYALLNIRDATSGYITEADWYREVQ